MKENKEKMEKSEIEVIRFEENDDIVTVSSFTGTGAGGQGFQPGPSF